MIDVHVYECGSLYSSSSLFTLAFSGGARKNMDVGHKNFLIVKNA